MSLINKPNTFTVGATIIASEHNANFDTIYNDYNGNIDNLNISASAAIVDTKLAQIVTPGKVDVSALANFQGVIVMWSGSIATIPTGWGLCDGTLYGSVQSPDLTDRFIIHADADSGGTNDVDDTGGSRTITTSNLPAHTHDYVRSQNQGPSIADGVSESAWRDSLAATVASGSTGGGTDYLPKYYALAYIIKT